MFLHGIDVIISGHYQVKWLKKQQNQVVRLFVLSKITCSEDNILARNTLLAGQALKNACRARKWKSSCKLGDYAQMETWGSLKALSKIAISMTYITLVQDCDG